MRAPDGAELTLAAGVALILAGDVRLHRRGERLVTDVLRVPVVFLSLLYVVAHVIDVLGPLDLFRHAGRLIPRRTP